MKKGIVLITLLVSTALWAVEEMPNLVDPRDKQVYKTVQIGEQRWMAENLRFKLKGTECYNKQEVNCEEYGRLYTWAAAMKLVDYYNSTSITKLKKRVHDVCPTGWHVPTNKEWKKMKYYVGKMGKSDGVGISLKSKDGWDRELRGRVGPVLGGDRVRCGRGVFLAPDVRFQVVRQDPGYQGKCGFGSLRRG